MLVKGEDEGVFALDEGKTAEEVRFFSTEVCSTDFHQRSVVVVEFGSRPAKRARLLSDKDNPVKEAQVCSFYTRCLAQGNFQEESDGGVGRMPQKYQADESMSHSDSGVTNELCSRSAGMKVAGCDHVSEIVKNRGNTEVVFEQTSGAQDDAKTGFLNHENTDRNAGSMIHLIQQDADDTVSTSGDEGLFVIKVRSPASKQLLHGQKQGIDQEDGSTNDQQFEESPGSRSDAQCTELADAEDQDNEPICYDAKTLVITEACTSMEVGLQNEVTMNLDHGDQLDRERQGALTRGMDGDIIDVGKWEDCEELRALKLDAVDSRFNDSKDFQQVSGYQAAGYSGREDGPQVQHVESKITTIEIKNTLMDAECVGDLGNRTISAGQDDPFLTDNTGSKDEERQKSYDQVEQSKPQVPDFASTGLEKVDKLIQEATAIGVSGTGSGGEHELNLSEIMNVYVRTRKRSTPTESATVHSAALQEKDCSSKLEEVCRLQVKIEEPLSEREIKHYVRRPHCGTDSHGPAGITETQSRQMMTSANNGGKESVYSPQAERDTDMSARVETEGNLNVFQRRSKTSHCQQGPSRNESLYGGKESACSPQAEHDTDMSARVETEGNLNVFQRRSKTSHCQQGPSRNESLYGGKEGAYSPQAEHDTDMPARVETEDHLNVFQRRSKTSHCQQGLSRNESINGGKEGPYLPQAEHDTDTSARVETEGNLNVFQRRSKTSQSQQGPSRNESINGGKESACSPQAEHDTDTSARVETEGNINVFQRRSKSSHSQQGPNGNESTEKQIAKCYVRPDHQPRWLPEGWTLEIRVREGKRTPARIRDKYYYDQKSGQRFRSRNEVLQFLEHERSGSGELLADGMDTKVQSQNKKISAAPIGPTKPTGFLNPPLKSTLGVQTRPASLTAPSPPFTHLHPVRMKTSSIRPTSAVSTEADGTDGTDMTWAQVEGPSGSIWLPWGVAGTGEQGQAEKTLKDAVASAFDGGATNSSRMLSTKEGARLPTGSPVPAVETASDQGDKENRGKLIFRLKRKQPDSDAVKGRSKRPLYEVVHGEKASSSTSTPTREEKLTLGERTSQDVLPDQDSMQMHVENISSVKKFLTPTLSPNVLSDSMSMKTQVEKQIPAGNSSFTNPASLSPVVMPSMALEQPTATKPGVGNAIFNWGTKQNPQQLGLLQQEPYTALGVPATARASGLQQVMASYSANHTHVFLDPVENTIPLSWQYPFTSQTPTPMTTSVPSLGPFPSVFNSPLSGAFSVARTVPVPVFEHFKGVSTSTHMNATASLVPCSESGVDIRIRDSTSSMKLPEVGPQIHKATAPKALTKVENSKLLLGLGRRLCLAGLEQKTRNRNTQSQTLATRLEEKISN